MKTYSLAWWWRRLCVFDYFYGREKSFDLPLNWQWSEASIFVQLQLRLNKILILPKTQYILVWILATEYDICSVCTIQLVRIKEFISLAIPPPKRVVASPAQWTNIANFKQLTPKQECSTLPLARILLKTCGFATYLQKEVISRVMFIANQCNPDRFDNTCKFT